jgi:chemotaxis protein MotB
LKPEATPQLDKLASALKELETKIPPDIAWVMRVDGHTDIHPIATPQFPSNWELSSERAISVVRYLMNQGVPANRLVAAGFGEFQPIDAGTSDDALARNRRIELKLTER